MTTKKTESEAHCRRQNRDILSICSTLCCLFAVFDSAVAASWTVVWPTTWWHVERSNRDSPLSTERSPNKGQIPSAYGVPPPRALTFALASPTLGHHKMVYYLKAIVLPSQGFISSLFSCCTAANSHSLQT